MSQKFNNVSYQCNSLQEKSEINEKINVKSLRKCTRLLQTRSFDHSTNMNAINCYCFYEYQISVN